MTMSTFGTFLFILLSVTVNTQRFSISDSLNNFGIKLLTETSNQAGDSINVALSTYSVWALMALLSEGARDNTLRQLQDVLELPADKDLFRFHYRNLTGLLEGGSNGATLELDSVIFANKDFPVKSSFRDIAGSTYDVSVIPTNFQNPAQAEALINSYVDRATKNRIPVFVNSGDVTYAQVFLASILYFKGQWTSPFEVKNTKKEPFMDENNQKIGEVDMMFQMGVFPYQRYEAMKFSAFELPYGTDRKMSMVIILPFKGESLRGVLSSLSRLPFSTILQDLETAERVYKDDEAYIYFPRFKYVSDFNLNGVLSRLGIRDIFDIGRADLLDMFEHYLYLSRFIQRAEIEVNEEGTTASAAAGAALPDRRSPAKFRVNKPFLYFIVDKPTRSVLFTGKISNPNTLK